MFDNLAEEGALGFERFRRGHCSGTANLKETELALSKAATVQAMCTRAVAKAIEHTARAQNINLARAQNTIHSPDAHA